MNDEFKKWRLRFQSAAPWKDDALTTHSKRKKKWKWKWLQQTRDANVIRQTRLGTNTGVEEENEEEEEEEEERKGFNQLCSMYRYVF